MKRFLSLLSFAAVLGLVAPTSAWADHRAPYHWKRSSNPFTVRVVDSFEGAWQAQVEAAAAKWETSGLFDLNIQDGSVKKRARKKCPVAKKGIRVCSYPYGNGKSWAGRTKVVYRGKHIISVSVKLNSSRVGGDAERRMVACHELGHAIGLGHRGQAADSCMVPVVDPSKREPDARDFEVLGDIYSHEDGKKKKKIRVSERRQVRHNGNGTKTVIWTVG